MHYIDTPTQRVDVFHLNDALRLRHHGAGRIFTVDLPVGGPPAAPYRG
jgi:hypothetical protein